MFQPLSIPGPDGARRVAAEPAAFGRGAVLAALAVTAGSAMLGLAAGFGWALLAPRPALVIAAPQQAAVVNVETSAFIVADALYCALCAAGGVASGLAGFLLAVRRWGPLPMAGVLAGAVAAAFLARWTGEQDGLAAFHHLLATLPPGARLRGPLVLGASSALACWPLAAALVAGGLTMLTSPDANAAAPAGLP